MYSALQMEAVFNALTNNSAFFERKVRRWYSKTFNTPLKDTFKVAWDEILIHYYESLIEDKSYNEIFDIAVQNYLPEFVDQVERENQAFAESLLEEQRELQRKKAAKDEAKKKKSNTGDSRASNKELMNVNFEED